MLRENPNILVIRTDRIGDVMLTLPLLPALKDCFPEARLTMMIRPYTRGLVDGHSCVDGVIEYSTIDSFGKFLEFVRQLREKEFDAAIMPYARPLIAIALFAAGIPVRIGTGYRWYSLFFNRRVFEHRKDAARHEVEYNLNLLKPLGILPTLPGRMELAVPAEAERSVRQKLEAASVKRRFIVLHPGSGGSARDWKPQNFAALADMIAAKLSFGVVLTGGPGEESIVQSVARKTVLPPASFVGDLSLKELAALIKDSACFISNSTGPLHMAAALGTPVIAMYPPIKACSPVRWGPYTDRKKIFLADSAQCPLCQGGPCRGNDCMDQITVEQVFQSLCETIL
ncbi:MAG: glycosyltransferase family 9 protein [Ignavibacteriales bacterium]|nr:glycosyltransferase family 9 protein [Ignavibacteriales bacterium]